MIPNKETREMVIEGRASNMPAGEKAQRLKALGACMPQLESLNPIRNRVGTAALEDMFGFLGKMGILRDRDTATEAPRPGQAVPPPCCAPAPRRDIVRAWIVRMPSSRF